MKHRYRKRLQSLNVTAMKKWECCLIRQNIRQANSLCFSLSWRCTPTLWS